MVSVIAKVLVKVVGAEVVVRYNVLPLLLPAPIAVYSAAVKVITFSTSPILV